MKTFDVGAGLQCDIDRLVASRLLIQANSGGGKTRTLRRLLEQTHGKVQHLVLDPEGEYHTLRERFDYVLAAPKGGDTVAHPRTAGLLAERLLQLGVSAILDIYELNPDQRQAFVKHFLQALVDAPRELWHPALVILDEAHVYAPEGKESDSTAAVKAMASRGRKRGFCLVPATQRLAKLAKDVAAECNNKLIGRCTLDVDIKRAAEELGFTTNEQKLRLRQLEPGQFFAYGPAFDVAEPRLVKVGAISTSHPEPGQHAAPVPPPTDKVRKVLQQLADLPAEAEAREKSIADLKADVLRLTKQLKDAGSLNPRPPAPAQATTPVLTDADRELLQSVAHRFNEIAGQLRAHGAARIESVAQRAKKEIEIAAEACRDQMEAAAEAAVARIGGSNILQLLTKVAAAAPVSQPRASYAPERTKHVARSDRPAPRAMSMAADASLGKCERAILTVLAQSPDGCTAGRLTLLTKYRYSGGFKNSLSNLRQAGLIEGANTGTMTITDAGYAAAGDVDPLPVGPELAQHWLQHPSFGACERAILSALLEHKGGMTADALCQATNYQYSGGFKNALSNLRTAGVLVGKNTETMNVHEDLR